MSEIYKYKERTKLTCACCQTAFNFCREPNEMFQLSIVLTYNAKRIAYTQPSN